MPRFSANLSMLFGEHEFLDRFDAAARAGFKGVEYIGPYDHAPDVVAARLKKNGLTQVLFNLPAGDWGKGERGIAVLPDRVDGIPARRRQGDHLCACARLRAGQLPRRHRAAGCRPRACWKTSLPRTWPSPPRSWSRPASGC